MPWQGGLGRCSFGTYLSSLLASIFGAPTGPTFSGCRSLRRAAWTGEASGCLAVWHEQGECCHMTDSLCTHFPDCCCVPAPSLFLLVPLCVISAVLL